MTGKNKRILVVGVGGQGVIFASKVIAEAFMKTGTNVIMSEVHGMAQRGGTVTCHLCIGDIHSSIIGDGDADILISFEPIETYRTISQTNKDTIILTDTKPLVPTSANVGDVKYPDPDVVLEALRQVNDHIIIINAADLALKAGSPVMANSVMLGALSGAGEVGLEPDQMKEMIIEKSPPNIAELNLKAFELGFDAANNRTT
jgi:indolepyruvate ferredoxin oxidoreductase beta subunit